MSDLNQTPETKRRPDRATLIIAIVLLVVAAVIVWDMSRLSGAASYARIGPQTVPYAIAAGLAFLGVWTIFAAYRGDVAPREHQETKPVLWIVGGLAAQMLLLNFAGFAIATGILFGMTARGFGKGPLWITIPAGFLLSLVVWVIFARLLQLSLPAGPIERLFIF